MPFIGGVMGFSKYIKLVKNIYWAQSAKPLNVFTMPMTLSLKCLIDKLTGNPLTPGILS